MKSSNRTLVVVAHPDDEALGCGGTIAKMAAAGHEVHIAFMADGVGARQKSGRSKNSQAAQRRANAQKACSILGAASSSFEPFPDNRMDSVDLLDVVQRIEALVTKYRPRTVLTHHAGDLNIDHRRVHDAVVTACRPQKGHPVDALLFFEIPSSTEWQTPGSGPFFAPNYFVDISGVLDVKQRALAAYKAELRPWPHPRSREGIEALARWRGATIGTEAAEAFVVGRMRA